MGQETTQDILRRLLAEIYNVPITSVLPEDSIASLTRRYRPDLPDTMAASFIDNFAADSLDIVEFMLTLEESARITVPEDAWARILRVDNTVAQMAKILDRYRDPNA
jgi:acyl carrier protein